MEKKFGKYNDTKKTPKNACGWVNLKWINDEEDESDNDPLLDD